MPDPVIECRNLTHRYGERLIYENLSFEVPHGRILGLLGKNGTGKTTTINILNGYLEPVAGECLIFGENIRTMRPQTRARIALLLEGHVQYAFMTIREIERFYSQYYPRWDAGLLRTDGAAGRRTRTTVARMSCGQRSQVALGLILAQNADLMILDDFSMGLDPGYRRLFVEYLQRLCPGAAARPYSSRRTSFRTWRNSSTTASSWITDVSSCRCPQAICSGRFRRYELAIAEGTALPEAPEFHRPTAIGGRAEFYSFETEAEVAADSGRRASPAIPCEAKR